MNIAKKKFFIINSIIIALYAASFSFFLIKGESNYQEANKVEYLIQSTGDGYLKMKKYGMQADNVGLGLQFIKNSFNRNIFNRGDCYFGVGENSNILLKNNNDGQNILIQFNFVDSKHDQVLSCVKLLENEIKKVNSHIINMLERYIISNNDSKLYTINLNIAMARTEKQEKIFIEIRNISLKRMNDELAEIVDVIPFEIYATKYLTERKMTYTFAVPVIVLSFLTLLMLYFSFIFYRNKNLLKKILKHLF